MIPSSILLVLFGIQNFEFSKKYRHAFEASLDLKLKYYENQHDQHIEAITKLKQEIDSVNTRLSAFKSFNSFK